MTGADRLGQLPAPHGTLNVASGQIFDRGWRIRRTHAEVFDQLGGTSSQGPLRRKRRARQSQEKGARSKSRSPMSSATLMDKREHPNSPNPRLVPMLVRNRQRIGATPSKLSGLTPAQLMDVNTDIISMGYEDKRDNPPSKGKR